MNKKLKKGKLLIAEPSIIGDTSFNRSVILLADDNNLGTVGFILNKPLPYALKDLIKNTNSNFKVFNGGPVEQDNLFFIHNSPDLIPESIEISKGLFWGGNFKIVLELINTKLISEKEIQFFLGYSGWDEKQLDLELESNSWLLTDNVYRDDLIKKNNRNSCFFCFF